MKRNSLNLLFSISITITFFLLASTLCYSQNRQNTTNLKGPYFGQKPPGKMPELFAPGLFNAEHGYHTPVVFSPDLTEAIWSPMEREHCLMYSRIVNGHWSTPRMINFGFEMGVGDATFSPDGNRIYFCSFQPPLAGSEERERIWFVERKGTDWSTPQLIDDVILAHPTHWTFSFAENQNLYFTSEIEGVRGEQDIYLARFDGEKYLEPVDLGEAINSDGKDLAPFVDMDESYLIFSRIGPDTRKADLYISFKDSQGNWTEARSMGERINSDAHDLCASVSPDGKYLFFVSQKDGLMNKIYWVDAAIIDSLRLDELSDGHVGPYLNQTPPGLVPQEFNPAITADWGVSVNLPYFDSTGTKCLFLSDFKLYETEVRNGVWSTSKMVDLGSGFEGHGVFGHGMSPDWRRLYFNSLRPVPDSCAGGRAPIWHTQRQESSWSDPHCIGINGMAVSVAASGNIYFTTWVEGKAQLAFCRFVDGSFSELEALPEPLLSQYEAMHPCIASDESYILFDSEDRPATGPCQLFVSFRDEKVGWSEPISLGNWIKQDHAAMAKLTADDRFLFYNDREGQTYWVSSTIIEKLKLDK